MSTQLSIYKTIEQFNEQFTAADAAVQKALGLAPRATELFFTAFDYVTEESGALVIGLPKAMKKMKYAPSQLQDVKKKRYFDKGPVRGQWLITDTALAKMRDMLNGSMEASSTGRKKSGTTPKKERSVRATRPATTPRAATRPTATTSNFTPPKDPKQVDIGLMTISDIETRLKQIGAMVEAYTAEGLEMERQLSVRLNDYRKHAASKKPGRK